MKKPAAAIKSQMRELRPFVSFNYDLRRKIAPQSIAKIRRYNQELQRLKSYPTIKYYRPRAKPRIKAAKKISILEPEYQKQFKVVPLADIPPTAKIKFRKDKLIGITEKLDVLQVPFSVSRYLRNPEKYIEYIKKQYPDYNSFRIKAGKHTVSGACEFDTMQNFLDNLLSSPKQKILTKTKRQEVFHSIIAYKTKGQEENNNDIAEKLK